MNVYEIITARIIEQLERGTVPWRKPWRGGADGIPTNLKSRRPYRGINVFLLATLGYESQFFLTFKQALERGGSVRKGEKGAPVIFWNWREKDERQPGGAIRKVRIPVLRFYTVFNAAQCDGIDAPPLANPTASDFQPIEICERIVAGFPNPPAIEHRESRAYYVPATDRVNMPRPELFTSPEEYYSTLFHELSHVTGHESRLDRKGLGEALFGSEQYSKEELVAEMGSAFLCGHAGIEPATLENSAAYIAGWLKRLRGDARLVVTAGAQAQKAADYILGHAADAAEPAEPPELADLAA